MFLNYYLAVCEMEAIGLATGGAIPDSSFTASSHYDSRYQPSYARLNGNNRGWAPETTTNPADFLQVDLPYEYIICAVATQGANGINEWTTKYKIQLSLDGFTFLTYKENNIEKVGGTVIPPPPPRNMKPNQAVVIKFKSSGSSRIDHYILVH